MGERETQEQIVGGLGLFSADRPVTRSITRALENQVVGSLFNQIDTGIPRPVDFLPTDFFNRCTAKIFSTSDRDKPPQTNVSFTAEVTINTSNESVSFARKLDQLFEMSDSEQAGAVGGADPAGSEQPGASGAEHAKAQRSDTTSFATSVEQLSRMMAMMAQQNDMMAQCFNEVRSMRANVSHLSNRVTEMEASAQAMTHRDASTPEATSHRSGVSGQRTDQHVNHSEDEISEHSQRQPPKWKKVDLDKWHVKFDGTNKSIAVESFLFRVERLRSQHEISYDQLFRDFHCLVTGPALKWYWQILEDHAEDPNFGYLALKTELLGHFKMAESDYEIIRQIMERKQLVAESFDDFYGEVHDLTFKLRNKIPEKELVGIIKGNLKPYLANLTFASKMNTLADLKAECRRAE